MDGVVDSPESVGASSSTRVQQKRRRKPFRARLRLSIGSSMTATASTKATKPTCIRAQFLRLRLLDSRPKKRRRTTTTTSSSSSVWTFCHHCRCKSRRPKMRCTLADHRVSRRALPQTVLRWLHRETVCHAIPFMSAVHIIDSWCTSTRRLLRPLRRYVCVSGL